MIALEKAKSNGLVSIIIPVYNTAQYLPRCLDSVLAQTYPHLEIILVNDGSTDQSGGICDHYAQADPRIRVIQQQNAGVSAARNAGLNEAQGEWIGFVDSDDWAAPTLYEKLLAAARHYSVQIAVCGHYHYRAHGGVVHKRVPKIAGKLSQEKALSCLISPFYFEGYLWNKLFQRNLLVSANIQLDKTLHFCEDVVFCTQLFIPAQGICYIPDMLYHYCLNSNSITEKLNKKRLTELTAWRRTYRIVVPKSPKLAKQTRIRYTDAAASLLYMAGKRKKQSKKLTDYLRKEVLRGLFPYLMSRDVQTRNKMRTLVTTICPLWGARFWLCLKQIITNISI